MDHSTLLEFLGLARVELEEIALIDADEYSNSKRSLAFEFLSCLQSTGPK